MLILTETKFQGDKAHAIYNNLPFDHHVISDTIGHEGGIWVLLKSANMDCQALNATEQEIHIVIQVKDSNSPWLLSVIYASLRLNERNILQESLKLIANLHNLPWVILGDFNKVIYDSEKMGGRPINRTRA